MNKQHLWIPYPSKSCAIQKVLLQILFKLYNFLVRKSRQISIVRKSYQSIISYSISRILNGLAIFHSFYAIVSAATGLIIKIVTSFVTSVSFSNTPTSQLGNTYDHHPRRIVPDSWNFIVITRFKRYTRLFHISEEGQNILLKLSLWEVKIYCAWYFFLQ